MKRAPINAGSALKAIIVILAVVVVSGCSSLRDTGRSWSQTAVNEEQQQELNSSPQGDLDMQP
jgi:hypothetical protein